MVLRVSSSPLLQNNERFSGESIMNTMQVQLHDILVRPEISYIETLKKDIQAKVFLETGIDIASLLYIDSPRYVDKKTVIENCYSYFENVANKLFSKIMTDPQMNLSSVGITHSQTQGEKISVLSPKKTLEYIKFIFSSKNLLEKGYTKEEVKTILLFFEIRNNTYAIHSGKIFEIFFYFDSFFEKEYDLREKYTIFFSQDVREKSENIDYFSTECVKDFEHIAGYGEKIFLYLQIFLASSTKEEQDFKKEYFQLFILIYQIYISLNTGKYKEIDISDYVTLFSYMRGKPQKMPLFPFLKNMEEEFQKSLLGEKFDPPLIEKYKKLSSLFEKIESIQDAILKKQIRKIVLSFPTFLLKQEGENFIDFILSKKYNSQDIESIFIFLGSIKGKWEISDLIAFIISNNTCLPYKELLEKKEKSSLVSFIGGGKNISVLHSFSYRDFQDFLGLEKNIQEKILQGEILFSESKNITAKKQEILELFPYLPQTEKLKIFEIFLKEDISIASGEELWDIFQTALEDISLKKVYIIRELLNNKKDPEIVAELHIFLQILGDISPEDFRGYAEIFLSFNAYLRKKIIDFSQIGEICTKISFSLFKNFIFSIEENEGWEDIETYYELYREKINSFEKITPNIKTLSLKEELENIFGKDFGNRLYTLPFSEKMRKMFGEIGRYMNGYFQQSYITFLEGNISQFQKNGVQLEEKGNILEKILFFFTAYGINTLENPTKLFLFVFFGNIESKTIDDLYDFFEDYEVSGKNFSVFVQSIMRYLKNSNIQVLEKLLKTSQEDGFHVQKSSSINQVATISFRECERKLFKLGFEKNPGKGGHIKYTLKDINGNFIFIILPHGADANINRYLIRSIIKKLFLSREQWHNL